MKDSQRVQKLLTFPAGLYRRVEKRADKFGVSVPSYIRYLVLFDVNKEFEKIPMVDEETEKRIEQGLKEYAKGHYYTVEPGETFSAAMERVSGTSVKTKGKQKDVRGKIC